jgi:hypothetical protein
VTADIFPGETIAKLRRQESFLLEYSIKSARKRFFLEKVRGGVKISIFQHSKSLPVTLEVSFAAEKYQPSDGAQFFAELRVSDQNCPNVL